MARPPLRRANVDEEPGFTSIAVLTLALGANTAIFSVAHATLLKPLTISETEALGDSLE